MCSSDLEGGGGGRKQLVAGVHRDRGGRLPGDDSGGRVDAAVEPLHGAVSVLHGLGVAAEGGEAEALHVRGGGGSGHVGGGERDVLRGGGGSGQQGCREEKRL